MRSLGPLLGLLVAAVAGPGSALYGQAATQVVVESYQGLRFGSVIPRVPSPVTPENAASRAELRIVGSGTLRLQLVLPSGLTSAAGHGMPIEFGAADGLLVIGHTGRSIRFDPRLPVEVNIPKGLGEARLYVGGTVHPPANAIAGDYVAVITAVVAAPGT